MTYVTVKYGGTQMCECDLHGYWLIHDLRNCATANEPAHYYVYCVSELHNVNDDIHTPLFKLTKRSLPIAIA